jgi:hemerythrin superfamily protein
MKTPEQQDSMSSEHRELHKELTAATKAGGHTADTAKDVMKVLFPHMLHEEEFAVPPLKLLPALARGEFDPDIQRVLMKTEALKAQLPGMLHEHKLIVHALRKLLQAAMSEHHARFARLAQKLILHAQMEEEVLYPASILVDEYIKLRLDRA